VVAGSSTRGGVRAVKQMLQLGRHSHLAITPDGPRGPRRQLQPGLVYLASRTGLGVVPIGVGLDRPWRLRSWDRFAIPRPWSRGTAVIGAPLRVPPDLSAAQLEPYRQSIEAELQRVSALAEEWAETGRLPQGSIAAESVLTSAAALLWCGLICNQRTDATTCPRWCRSCRPGSAAPCC
jgi:hypothetical protein